MHSSAIDTLSSFLEEFRSLIFAPSNPVIDTNGAPSDVNDVPQGPTTGAEDPEPPTNGSNPVIDTNG